MEKKTKKAATDYKTSEPFVVKAMIAWLFRNGFGHNLQRATLKEHGVDIRVQDNGPHHTRYFFIEAKGASSSMRYQGSVNNSSVLDAIGEIITRMKVFAPNCYGIAFPEPLAKVAIRRLPWQVAKKLLLSVFSVDKNGQATRYSWKEIKKLQQELHTKTA
jgi:hypothetical protein